MTDGETSNTLERIKKHFSDNKKLYFGIAIGAVVAGTGVYIWHLKSKCDGTTINAPINAPTIIDSAGSTINQIHIERHIHPGYITQCRETGTTFASMKAAAREMDLPYEMVRKHSKGLIPDVMGYTFEFLGDAHPPL